MNAMSAAENKKLMEEIFARIATGDGSLFAARCLDLMLRRAVSGRSWAQIAEVRHQVGLPPS